MTLAVLFSGLPAISAAAATAATATVSTAAATVFFRTGFIDVQGAAIKVLAVEGANGSVRIAVSAHLDECKASGLAGIPVGDYVHAFDGSKRFKQGSNGIFGRPEAEISYEYVFHRFPSEVGAQLIGQDRTKAAGTGRCEICQNRRTVNNVPMMARIGHMTQTYRPIGLAPLCRYEYECQNGLKISRNAR
jgi:hypothetical protein